VYALDIVHQEDVVACGSQYSFQPDPGDEVDADSFANEVRVEAAFESHKSHDRFSSRKKAGVQEV
jgi:hypothetical protein